MCLRTKIIAVLNWGLQTERLREHESSQVTSLKAKFKLSEKNKDIVTTGLLLRETKELNRNCPNK